MKKFGFLSLIIFALFFSKSFAGEGMWIPSLLSKFNIEDMHKEGFRLSAEDIYSINHSSLKDAVVIFGGGCTGEIISDKGLIITNHHCGYGAIQSHSSVENNYLKNGFWAGSMNEELPNQGLKVTFLERIEDVTEKVNEELKANLSERERRYKLRDVFKKIENEATDGTDHKAVIKSFYYGNEFYMFIYKEYKDIRLVGAPPSSIGKFGGDLDNWMWPRHTGDFSLFRIYADKNNEPAEYDKENVPYNPDKHLKISLKGIDKGDFTMVMGYPGSTQQYLTSHAINLVVNKRNPQRIKLRDKRLEVMEKYMEKSESIKIKYATKHSRVSNSWKRWKGEIRGLKRLNAIQKKQKLESNFVKWISEKPERKESYGSIIEEFSQTYENYTPYVMAMDYFREAGYSAIEIMRFSYNFKALLETPNNGVKENLKDRTKDFFKDYIPAIDKEISTQMLKAYYKKVDETFHPEIYNIINNKYEKDFSGYINNLFENSIFTDSNKVYNFIREFEASDSLKIINDPAFELVSSFVKVYQNDIVEGYDQFNMKLDSLYRIYVQGLKKMKKDEKFWPDANFTMRIAYGEVKGYSPNDAVDYRYYTTLDGVIQKNATGKKDYVIPDKLKKLYRNKNFGRYAMESGELPVCFIATNHTSGGNSGSPVINANGELIGINFDRNWEGTMSDYMYDPSQCRNITLDIRYALFIIDKFAGADRLINEMTIIK